MGHCTPYLGIRSPIVDSSFHRIRDLVLQIFVFRVRSFCEAKHTNCSTHLPDFREPLGSLEQGHKKAATRKCASIRKILRVCTREQVKTGPVYVLSVRTRASNLHRNPVRH
ncbi:unnamed protein product [Notodromas monacha]|uniref:Uncharacterized protein n=1 Tax=Notodromas monacha TaxID=399045 RepID=A0A7R9C1S9_9CRUS|nr:unnamed protein product [Notodromas monacha]CAG0924811.1 unnamed protein product [Notodromas monacha]